MGRLLTYTNVIQQRASVWAMCRRERSLFVVVDNLGRLPFLRESGGRSVGGRHARTGPRRGIRLTSVSAWRSERWKKVVDLELLLLTTITTSTLLYTTLQTILNNAMVAQPSSP